MFNVAGITDPKGRDMKPISMGVTGLVLTMALTTACMPQSSSGSDSGDSDGPIKLGAAVSQTGAYSVEGKSTKEGYELWAKEVNADGGIDVGGTKRKVEIVYYDDQSKPETAIKLTQRLISEDKVDFLLGPYSSGLTIATSAIAAQYKKIMFAGGAAANSVFEQGNEYVFSPLSLTSEYTVSGLDALHDAGAKSVGILHSDDAPMTDVKDATVEHAEELGMEVTSTQAVPVDANDIKGALGQIAASKPDVLVEAGTSVLGTLTMRTLRTLDWAPEILMIQAPTETEFVDELGVENTRGVMAPTQWVGSADFEGDVFGTASDYRDLYVEEYGHEPSYLPASASAAALALQLAIEEAGSTDTEEVQQALVDLEADTFYGPLDFTGPDDPSGLVGANIDREMLTIQLDENGKQVVVAPEDVAEAEMVPFDPWSKR
jgi:branched-chain amino acid transport system substrate-binding protein